MKSFDIVFMSYVNDLLLSVALKFETTLFGWHTKRFHGASIFFGLLTLAESSSSKSDCFFAVIDFCASYFTYSFNSLSIWSLIFLNYFNSLSFSLSFWTTSLSNQFWVFWLLPLIRLFLQTVTWSMTVISFQASTA